MPDEAQIRIQFISSCTFQCLCTTQGKLIPKWQNPSKLKSISHLATPLTSSVTREVPLKTVLWKVIPNESNAFPSNLPQLLVLVAEVSLSNTHLQFRSQPFLKCPLISRTAVLFPGHAAHIRRYCGAPADTASFCRWSLEPGHCKNNPGVGLHSPGKGEALRQIELDWPAAVAPLLLPQEEVTEVQLLVVLKPGLLPTQQNQFPLSWWGWYQQEKTS
jgi:hypothetical protein